MAVYIAILFEGMFVGAQWFCAITKIEQANIDSWCLYSLAAAVNFIILLSEMDRSTGGNSDFDGMRDSIEIGIPSASC
ncbi:hypothetical protein QEZ47_13465 [Aminobacter anthyllidis]|uniref:hypothetical protein n=1 Tax=Aminobacter anthyllidis TaxID=1035067 RepID=UPI00245638F5|nr:hypothetical protein [Aminobacter anthyllidis]MDH4986518.1 hypothetical protein [Aminobacter anthyllidis]